MDWGTSHVVAWRSLWENVKRMLVKDSGNPSVWEAVLGKFYASLDETQKYELRKDVYARFFAVAPSVGPHPGHDDRHLPRPREDGRRSF